MSTKIKYEDYKRYRSNYDARIVETDWDMHNLKFKMYTNIC